jgi:type II secretory pathway component GspD/PulD (secretin)
MRICIATLAIVFGASAHAEKLMEFYFKNADVSEIIDAYARQSGKKFVIGPNIRGKADILVQEKVPLSEAFNLLSSALAFNGLALIEQQGTYVVQIARNLQNGSGPAMPVTDTLPPLKPERMMAYVYTPKHVSADLLQRNFRIASSKDGEMDLEGNKLILKDWVSNIHRIHKTLQLIDVPGNDIRD